ncbi:Gfo/Idh/MocA family protein [Streptomyces paludis]|uniref:Gfo/Idh/MocA family protein n=1 Tax=Streptomyces paludis TaxID=2282738 RepID=UPI0013B3E9C3|nr:Gfo/Idh/MocA family oxidoreductase [Streptomyces paludis]
MSRGWRVLVVGCGWISRHVHLPYLAGLRATGGLRSLYVADADPDRATRAARDFSAEVHTGPLERARADLVLVATPPADHATLTLRALATGARVIVEKPLALTTGDAAAVLAAARRHGGWVYPLYTMRHRPEAALIRRSVLAQRIGPVREMRASWLRRDGVPATQGGTEAGVLWDLGSHLVDLALWLPDWYGNTGKARAEHQHPAAATGEVPHAGWQHRERANQAIAAPKWHGVRAEATLDPERRLHLEASWAAPGIRRDQSRIDIVGEQATLTWHTVFGWSPDRRTVPAPTLWITDADGREQVLLHHQPRDPYAEYTAQLDTAFTALTAPTSDDAVGPLEAAYASTALLHAMQTSLDTAAPVPFDIRN